jgi:sulfur carrier protein
VIEVIINGVRQQVSEQTTVAAAVGLLTPAVSGVAAAVNGEVVARAAWQRTQLAAGDQLEVITAVQGG